MPKQSKLTDKNIAEIKKRLENGETFEAMYADYGYSGRSALRRALETRGKRKFTTLIDV